METTTEPKIMKTEQYKAGEMIPPHILRAAPPERQSAATFGCDVTVNIEQAGITVRRQSPGSEPMAVISGQAIEGETWTGAPTTWLQDAECHKLSNEPEKNQKG